MRHSAMRLSTISSAGGDELGGGQHVSRGHPAAEVLRQDERQLGLDLGMHQLGPAEGTAVLEPHAVEQVAVVGLRHACHVLHGLARQADLLPDHPVPEIATQLRDGELHRVGVGGKEPARRLRQRWDRRAALLGLPQPRGQRGRLLLAEPGR
jgi:hypothetical protein